MTTPMRMHPLISSLTILCASAGLALPVAAQQRVAACDDDEARIAGVVVDASTEAPLSGAYVSVAASDWGSLTIDDGRFLLCGIAAGPQVVTVERLGYETLATQLEASVSGEAVRLQMTADPILLEGLEIVANRFERRRRAVATSVRTYDEEALAGSLYWSAADFVDSRPGVMTTPCGIERCIYSRGNMVRPRVYLDEFPLMGGWVELESVPTSQLYMVEVYGWGRHIRAYTHSFMERAAKVRLAPMPLWY